MNEKEQRIRMVLYKMHDYDLVSYACSLKDKSLGNAKISFYSIVKGLLNQYIGKGTFSPPRIKNYTKKKLPSKITIRFTLDKKDDAELIDLFKNIKDRQKNSFLKSLVRRNLDLSGLDCYFVESYDCSKLVKNIKEPSPKEIIKPKKEKIEIPKEKTFTKNVNVAPEPIVEDSVNSGFDFFGALGDLNK